ncbi:trypsin-like serine protease [Pseudoalteromonas luteoviolacea]|uniref:serine protease n=1 Tax=Pseudoalteromonas luteoviolacea TaxID=43657 RepID=UPI001B39E733|nr:serine protease [Pseudoalteromonas luteoviolacea]MBQ4877761.1 trypsin-like serine protease [Pseudoalteromonas luteoviolacea]MBQ4906793.1 trypsin-like serine protease [Pseudoalteromonas luteoviolacea]
MLKKIQGILLLTSITTPLVSYAIDKQPPSQKSLQKLLPIQTAEVTPRIVGGEEAIPHSYPFMGGLQLNGSHWCGLSFIGDNKVLTASHCVDSHPANEFTVIFEGHDLSDPTQWQTYQVTQIMMHEQYGAGYQFNNDIAVLELDRNVENIEPIKLANQELRDSLIAGDLLKVMGWGRLSSEGDSTKKLREVDVPYVPNEICNDVNHYNGYISDTMMCAGIEEGGKDSCQGDSGGPLVIQNNGEWVQVGVVSWGDGCALPNKPGVYADVAPFLLWTYVNAFDFGFDKLAPNNYVPAQSSATITGSFKNTLNEPVNISRLELTSESSVDPSVDLIEQNCDASTLAPEQECTFTIQTYDDYQYGHYNISANVEQPFQAEISNQSTFRKVSDFSEDINEYLATSENIIWTTGGDQKWYIGELDSGKKALFSGDITDQTENSALKQPEQKSYLLIQIEKEPDISKIKFDYLLSSEQGYDFVYITHNDERLLYDSGTNNEPINVEITLKDGLNQILIEYHKDFSVSVGTDNVSIQNFTTIFANKAPTAIVTQSELEVRSEFEFVMDAIKSSDVDGDHVTYQWIDISNPESILGTDASITLTAEKVSVDTTKTYQVIVTDEFEATDTAFVTVNILANQVPIIEFKETTIDVRSELEFVLDASATIDPEKDTLTYTWFKLGAGYETIGDSAMLQIKADKVLEDTTITYQLTVSDIFGAETTEQVTVNIAKNNAPEFTLENETQSVSAGEEVVITATANDPDGDELTYAWSQTSGSDVPLPDNSSELSFTTPTVAQDETLTFTLTVTDSFGLSHSQEISVNVNAPVAPPPTVNKTDDEIGSSGSFSLMLIALVAGFRRFTSR